jgi:secreted trypsin-like serine protease
LPESANIFVTMTFGIVVFLCLLATALANPTARIVQGTPAALFSHPHQASLQVQRENGWFHICGAVIYERTKILTAAHCLQGQTASKMRIQVGALNLYDAPNEYTQFVGVTSFVIHESYNPNGAGIPNDIGIIYLSAALVLNANVQIAPLAAKGSTFVNTKCVITGWGQTSGSGGGASPILLEVKVTKISVSECQLRWPFQGINAKHICVYEASAPSGSRPSACMGDSGGPMMCGAKLEFLAGLTSWGVSNCSGNYPSVYTRVSEFLDWIASK